ncbi:MAG: CHASE3 domain-containing protein [Alphaproteobacteria bacterium]|nr:CHASE3 domain-containing protein [Alphaproteobacteria bacterium]
MQTRPLLFLVALPALVVLLALMFLIYLFGRGERIEQAWVLHTYQVMEQVRKVFSDVQDAETGARGYLLTRQNAFLQPYTKALADLDKDMQGFESLTRDNPRQQKRVMVVKGLVAQRLAALAQTRAAGLTTAIPPSPALLQSMLEGQARMVALRGEVAAALAEERQLLKERIAARHAAERLELAAALAAAAVVLIILIAAALMLIRSNMRLSASEADRNRHAYLLQATLDNIRDGIAVFDGEGKLVAFNSNFFGCMGFPTELAVQGTHISKFDALADQRKHVRFVELPFVTGGYGAGYRDITFDNRHIELYRNHVPSGGFLVACLDVTQRVQSEMALRQAQKMETVGQLTGGVAHDFNNLLQIIGANLDLLLPELEGNARAAARLRSAVSAVDRGSRLTGQLLAFARRQPLAPRALNLARLLHDMNDLLGRTLGERIELESIVAGGLWNTLVDQSQLENAILNLAINARDAMPDGGKLTIELANAYLDDHYAAEHAEVAAGQYVMAAVTDTGTGMPPEVVARAVEPFYTTKPEGRGTGLGLSQVYGFVKQSGGHVKIYSELGEGTTVKLYLPRSTAAAQWTAPSLVKPEHGGGETVLVVEDDEAVRSAVTDMLAELGYAVLQAENAEQAIAVLQEGAKASILFTDVVMPGRISTRELARAAKEMLPDIRVLFTSGYTQNAIVHHGRLDEGVELLSKPYRKDELARKLRGLLQQGSLTVGTGASGTAQAQADKHGGAPGTKVLIVEDSALIRMTVVDMIEEIGLPYAEAGDGATALEILARDQDIGVLLTDLGLPGMTGTQLVQQALKLNPGLRVVVASGYSEPPSSSVELRGAAFLRKPFTLLQLRAALA